MLGSVTATPSIRPSVSCSAAASAAPAPLETDDAITVVLSGLNCGVAVLSGLRSARSSFSTQNAKRTALSVSRPQSFSGFCCECACLTAWRFGVAALKAASSAADSSAVKLEFLPAAAAPERRPFCVLTVSVARS